MYIPIPIPTTTEKWHGRDYGDYYYYDGGPWKNWQYFVKTDYIFEEKTKETTIEVSGSIDIGFSVFGLFLNLVHLFVLSRKELRTNVVFILMIEICFSDILVSASSITETYFGGSETQFNYNGQCKTQNQLQYWYTFIELVSQGIQKFGKFTSSILTLAMAIIRTISVLFPMSSLASRLIKAKTGVITGLITFLLVLFWCLYYYHKYQVGRRYFEDIGSCYIITSYDNIGNMQVILEGFALVALTIIYIFVTVALMIVLRMVKRKQKRLGTVKPDNTSMLVLTMAIVFFISQLIFSIVHILSDKDNEHVDVAASKLSDMFKYVANSVLKLNSILHCFICFLMSSQYRDVVKKLIGFEKWKMRITHIPSNTDEPMTATRI